MAREITLESCKTYANPENARKALLKKIPVDAMNELRYFIHTNEAGRCFPVFIGEVALQRGIHFHFPVVM